MDRKFVGALLLLLASTGCRMGANYSDDLPPVLDGPYPYPGGRAGSAFGGVDSQPLAQDAMLDQSSKESTPEEQVEDSTAAIEE